MEMEVALSRLEKSAKRLTLDQSELESVSSDVLQYIHNFWSNLPRYKAYEGDNASSRNIFKEKIANVGRSLKDILGIFHESVTMNGAKIPSGGQLGLIPSGGLPLSAFGDFIAAATNEFVARYLLSPGAVNMEDLLIEWTADLFGYDVSTCGGNLCSGSSIGGLMSVVAARDKYDIKADVYSCSVVYVSEHTHFFIEKALRIVGMGECIIRKISANADYSIDTSMLKETLESDTRSGLQPFLIVGTLGTTSTGAIDNIQEMGILAKQFDCWFHVDAAYGGYFVLLDEMKEKFCGVDQADSITVDPHKSLFLPFGSGIVLVKNRKDLLRTFSYTSEYLNDSDYSHYSPSHLSPELSRNFRGLRMWLPLMYHGTDVFVDALREKVLLSKYAYNELEQLDFITMGPPPQLTVFTFRYNGQGILNGKCTTMEVNQFNKHMLQELHTDGRVYITDTLLDGVVWLRVAILCFRTHKREVDILLDMIRFHFKKQTNNDKEK